MKNKTVLAWCAALFGAWFAVAAENSFVGSDGVWSSDGNWSLGREPTADDDVVVNGKTVVCTKEVSVASLTLTGASRVTFRNPEKTEGVSVTDWQSSAALLWAGRMKVSVAGKLTVGAGASLFAACESETGSIVTFSCGALEVAAGGTVSADRLGYQWVQHTGTAPENTFSDNSGDKLFYTYAYGHGKGYGEPAGYGGAGSNPSYGRAYGYRAAPFMPGSPVGTYNGNLDYPSAGSVVLFVSGHAQVHGTITAAETTTSRGHGANTGGGIWLCAATLDLPKSASVRACGGTSTANYQAPGGGGRIAIGLGLTAADIAALATGAEPEDLVYVDAYAASCDVLAGWGKNGAGTRGNPGTALYVYRASAVDLRGIASEPQDIGAPSPSYGFYAYAKGQVPEVTFDEAVYSADWLNNVRYARANILEPSGDAPVVVAQYVTEARTRVLVRGTGSVTCDGTAHASDFDVWKTFGETLTLAGEGSSFVGWYGDTAGGCTSAAELQVAVTCPKQVQAVFSDLEGVARAYTGPANGFWEEASNWTPSGVPSPLDDLTVPAGKSVRGLHALAAKSLTVGGAFALGGTTPSATVAQKLTDCPAAVSGLLLTGDLAVSGTLSVGELTQAAPVVASSVGGSLTLSGTGKLAVFAPENAAAMVAPYAGVYAARLVFAVGGDLVVDGQSVLSPVAEPHSGTPVEWRVGGNVTIAEKAQVSAENAGFNWSPRWDERCFSLAVTMWNGEKVYTMAPGHGNRKPEYNFGCHYGGGERAYGSPYAPFMPGSHSSIYNSQQPAAGGGTVFIRTAGELTLNGTVNANGMRPSGYSGNSGGSIWLAARKFNVGSAATLTAIGGKNGHSALGYAGSGGRIALAIGLSDAEIDALGSGTAPADLQGVTAIDEITLVKNVDVKGGPESTKGANNQTLYGPVGTVATLSGASADTIVTVVGSPVAPSGANGPVYEAVACPQGAVATFTATETCSLEGRADERYTVAGWRFTNVEGEVVASGTGASAAVSVGKEPLTLTWLWAGRETRTAVASNDAGAGEVLVDGAAAESVWIGETSTSSMAAVPAEGCEFLYWIGDVPYGKARQNPLTVDGRAARRITAVFRTAETACARTWKGAANAAGDWLDASLWEPAGVPGLDDDVVIDRGTCDVSNFVAVGSLVLRDTATLRIAVTSVKGAVRYDILSDYQLPLAAPLTEEAGLVVTRSLTLEDKAQLAVGMTGQTRRSNLVVGGDLSLAGTNKLVVAGGETDETYTFAHGAGFITVGGRFGIADGSVLHVFGERYTGGSVVIRAETFDLAEKATVAAWKGGFWFFNDRTPGSHAPGQGFNYLTGGGYGGYGLREGNPNGGNGLDNGYGQPYGQEYAPVHPGSCRGSYGNDKTKYAGGLIRIHANAVRLDGRLDARPSETDEWTSGSGGGIWVTSAGAIEVGANAVFTAKGGRRCWDTSYAGGGGRIALASHVTDEQVAEMALTGEVAGWKARHYNAAEAFLAAHPTVVVDVTAGESVADYNAPNMIKDDSLYTGTFRVIDGRSPGFCIIVR